MINMLCAFVIYELRILFENNSLQFILTNMYLAPMTHQPLRYSRKQNRLKGKTRISITLSTF